MSVNVLSLKLLIFRGPYIYISYWTKARHFTWSSKPCKGLAVCKAKVVPSMFSHFKTASTDQTHNLTLCRRKFRVILLSYLNQVLEQLNTYLYTTSHFETFLHYVIKYAWFYKLMCDAAFQWLLRKLSCRFKKQHSYYTSTRKLVHIPCRLHQRSTASLGLMVTFWVMFEKQIHHLNVACFAGNIYFNVWRVVKMCTLDKIMPDCSLRNQLTDWFPHQMTSEKWAQKFHTDDASLLRSGQCFWLVVLHEKFDSTNQKLYPDLCSDESSVWNFCASFSDVIRQGNQW